MKKNARPFTIKPNPTCQVRGCKRKSRWTVCYTLEHFAGRAALDGAAFVCATHLKAHEAKRGTLPDV